MNHQTKHPHQELIQIDTTNILFICGGAFNGLENLIEKRFEGGRGRLDELGIPVLALAVIESMKDGQIVFAE